MNRIISLCIFAVLALPSMVFGALKPEAPTTGEPAPAVEPARNTPVEVVPVQPAPKLEAPAIPSASTGPTYVFPLTGKVDELQLIFLRRALKEAEQSGAAAFIIDMNTPGGHVDVTMDILELLRKTKLPTITFINPSAGSAGSLISLGTKKIFMRRDAVIGAAAVVTGDGADLQKSMKLKVDSFNSAKMRAVAEENGHNPDIAEAFMVVDKELKIGDIVLDGKETLLSLNGSEATRIYNGKPLLALGLAETVEDVMKLEGLTGKLTRVEPTVFETTALWLTNISWLLLLGGIVGGYIEMKAPGFGIPGIISLVCFALFFLGQYIAALSGWEATIFFVIGAALVIMELFLLPGLIIPGLIGVVLVFGSIVWAMVDHWPSQPGSLGGVDFEKPMFNLVLALAGAALFAAILAKVLPHTSIYSRMVLASGSPGNDREGAASWSPPVRIGETGVAATTLRPAGKATFADQVVDVMSDGEFIDGGAEVRVVSIEGMKVIVEPVS